MIIIMQINNDLTLIDIYLYQTPSLHNRCQSSNP